MENFQSLLGAISAGMAIISGISAFITYLKTKKFFTPIFIFTSIIFMVSSTYFLYHLYILDIENEQLRTRVSVIESENAKLRASVRDKEDREELLKFKNEFYNDFLKSYADFISDMTLYGTKTHELLLKKHDKLYSKAEEMLRKSKKLGKKTHLLDHLSYLAVLRSALEYKSNDKTISWAYSSLNQSKKALRLIEIIIEKKNNDEKYSKLDKWIRETNVKPRLHYMRAWCYTMLYLKNVTDDKTGDKKKKQDLIKSEIELIDSSYLLEYPLRDNTFFKLAKINGDL